MFFYRCNVIFLVFFTTTEARKYDIDAEAIKLYGEDYNTVLMQFRRTSDYLAILEDRVAHLKQRLMDIGIQALHYYNEKKNEKIAEIFSANADKGADGSKTNSLRNFQDLLKPEKSKYRRNAEKKNVTLSPVEQLDEYRALTSPLSTTERNHFKDMGFDMAGLLIKDVIKGLGPEDEPAKSTKMEFGGGGAAAREKTIKKSTKMINHDKT